VNIRIIAATHRNLEELVRAGTFRQDLFYRLNVVPLVLPPLRERPADVEALAQHFIERFAREVGKRVELSQGALAALAAYDWPGNVRELRNVLERAAVLADPQMVLEASDFCFDMLGGRPPDELPRQAPAERIPLSEQIEREKRGRIEDALRKTGGSIARAARLLNVKRTTLGDQIRRLGIK
jgi:transcriptional regulator with GAF, ATPase, and Fis domain